MMLLAANSTYSKRDQERIVKGLENSPVTLNLAAKDKDLVGMGSYLVNASNCATCHSCPTYDHRAKSGGILNAANYLAGGVPFAESGYKTPASTNITPDEKGLPGGLTLQQFKVALTQQSHIMTSPDLGPPSSSGPYSSPMPRALYSNFVESDVRAIYAYLRAVPRATPGSCKSPGETRK
jgi:hypothetical protein